MSVVRAINVLTTRAPCGLVRRNHPSFLAMSSAPKQPIPLGRPSRIARASSLPQPAPLLRRRLGRDKALFSVCVCVCASYERPCPPSVFCPDSARRLRPSRLPAHNHRPFSVSLVFAPSSSLLARCMLFSPSAFQPSPSQMPLLSVCVSPVSARHLRPSRLPAHNHRPFSVSLVFPPFPSSPLRLQPPSRWVHASASLRFSLRRRLRTTGSRLCLPPLPAPATSPHGQCIIISRPSFQNP